MWGVQGPLYRGEGFQRTSGHRSGSGTLFVAVPPPPRRAFRSRGRGQARAAFERSPDAWYPADQVHHRRRYSMAHFAALVAAPKPDRPRALRLLTNSRDSAAHGRHGFSVDPTAELINAAFAAPPAKRMRAGTMRTSEDDE